MSPDMVVEVVFPTIEATTVPLWFNVQFPAGKPEMATDPVAKAQVGGVITPIVGAAGVIG